MESMRNMGHEIFALMKEKNISEEELAAAVDCPLHIKIHRLKWGRLFPSYSQLEIIADLLGTTIDHLLDPPDAYPAWQDKILDIVDQIIDIRVFGIKFVLKRMLNQIRYSLSSL